jgi:gluconolactonase
MTGAINFQSGLGFIEGPAWNAVSQQLSLVSISDGCVYVLDHSGTVVRKIKTGGGPNGLVLARDAAYVAQNGGIFGASGVARPCVQRSKGDVIDELFVGDFNAPNDICFGPDGRLYVTDPASDKAVFEPIEGRVLVCDLRSGRSEVVAEGRYFPNGLAFDESGERMYLTHTYSRLIERFSFRGGSLHSDGTLCEIAKGRPDGMALDVEGNLWVCTPGTGGLEVFTKAGAPIRRIELGEGTMTTNCCFGGHDMKTLYVTAAGIGTVLALLVDVPGLGLRQG